MRVTALHPLVLVLLSACGGLEAPSSSDTKPATTSAPPTPGGSDEPTPAPPPPRPTPPAPGTITPSSAPCPTTVAAPADCGPYASACAGATPLVVGTFSLVRGFALDDTSIVWGTTPTDFATCGDVLYRTPRAGGTSTALIVAPGAAALEADAAGNVFWVEQRSGASLVHALATTGIVQTVATSIMATAPSLARSATGVLLVDGDAIARLRPDGVDALVTTGAVFGSEPAFDGTSLFAARGDGALVAWDAASGASTSLGDGATTRARRTVATRGGDVYFVVGDDESDSGVQPHPMGISRVATTGGAITVIVPPRQQIIDTIAVDEQRVYFTVGREIRAVARAGGPVVSVATLGAAVRDLRIDDQRLYFRLDVGGTQGGELSAPGGVIATVPKLE